MQIEVIVNGKGSITIEQKLDFAPKQIRSLTTHATDLLREAVKVPTFGFAGGTSVNTEMVEDE